MDDIRENSDYNKLVRIGASETGTEQEVDIEDSGFKDRVSVDQMMDYVNWRAMGKAFKEASLLARISENDARMLESADDFLDSVIKRREIIQNNPDEAMKSMIPEALGILKEDLRKGKTNTALEILKITKMNSSKESSKTNENSGPSKSTEERDKVRQTGRQIRDRYRAPAEGSEGETAGAEGDTDTEPKRRVVAKPSRRKADSEEVQP